MESFFPSHCPCSPSRWGRYEAEDGLPGIRDREQGEKIRKRTNIKSEITHISPALGE